MKIAFITTDNRETWRNYEREAPDIGMAPGTLLQGFAQLGEHEIHVLSCTQQPVAAPEKLAENIWFHSLLAPKIGWLRTGYQGCIRAIRRRLREIQPDVAHGQGTERDCAIGAAFSGFPNVITVHGNMRMIARVNHSPMFSYNWCAARMEAFTLPRSGGVVCITDYTKKEVASLARRTWIIPNAVDSSFFSVEPKPSERPMLLCVGTICLRKNQHALIHALDSLQPRLDFELCILGETDPSDAYSQRFLELLPTRPWVRYEGFADREKTKRYFSEATMLILPSLEENCPMVVLEAQAAGVPVAASAVGGIPELVSPGKTGLLFNPENPEEIRQAVEAMISQTGQSAAMAAEARKFARATFDPLVVVRQHIQVYQELLANPLP